MDKLYSRKTRFDEVLAGKYSLPVMLLVVGIFVALPWDEWGRISWYASVIEFQESIFPNLRKLSLDLPPERAELFRPMLAFINIVEWPLFIFVLSKVPIADKIVSGEMKIKSNMFVLMFVFVGCAFSPWIILASGTQGGMLTKITRATDYGLTMVFVFSRWGVILLWYILLSILLGLIKKRQTSLSREKGEAYMPSGESYKK
jgi:hypothetical protein